MVSPDSFLKNGQNNRLRHKACGSLTIECALVLPLFFFGMCAMISFMDLYRLETIHLSDLCQAAKLAATYTYNPVGDGPEDLTLPDFYTFHPVCPILPISGIFRFNTVTVRSWNGRPHETFHQSLVSERMVYVTESGTVFHRKINCRYLSVRVTSIASRELGTRRNSYGQTYAPCEHCVGAGLPAGIVYITAKGTRYHNSETCSALKRTIRLVRESEAGLPACSVCGGG